MESKQRIQHNTCMSSRGETKAGKKSNRFKKYVTIISQSITLYTIKSYCLSLCLSVANRFTLCTYSCSCVVMIVIHIMQILMCLQRASKSSISVTCCCSFTNHFEVVKREQQHSKQDSKANYTCTAPSSQIFPYTKVLIATVVVDGRSPL